jgi:hypothetical protein
MLVFDVLDDRIPAIEKSVQSLSLRRFENIPSIVVDLVTVARGIDNVQPQTHTVFLNDLNRVSNFSKNLGGQHTVRDSLDFGGRTDGLIGSQTTLGINQVRGKDGVDQG